MPKLTIGNNVKTIPADAFCGCSCLTEVIIPYSVTSIGSSAFGDCTGLIKSAYPKTLSNPFSNGVVVAYNPEGAIIENGWIFGPEKKAIFYAPLSLNGEYVIPESVTSIGGYAFYGCTGLTSVTIPDSVTSIGQSAFSGCSGLIKSAYPKNLSNPFSNGVVVAYNPEGAIIENGWIFGPEKKAIFYAPLSLNREYVIPESVTSIGDYAFARCTGLTSVTIPDSVTSIGQSAFSGCTGIKQVNIQDGENTLALGVGDNKQGLFNDSPLEEVYIGRNLTYDVKDQNSPFAKQKQLKKVTLGGGITAIPAELLYKCESIEDIVIPNGVTSIGDYAFCDCTGLTEVIIPNSVTSIGSSAFRNCTGLTEVVIPNKVTSIGSEAFKGCTGLIKSAYPKNLSNPFSNGVVVAYNPEGAIIENGWIFGPEKTAIFFAPLSLEGEYTIPGSVTSIGDYAFARCSALSSVAIPESVTSIGSTAFRNCTGLTSVTIPNSVTSIGDYAFYGCTGLTEVNVSWEEPVTIERNTFSDDTYSTATLSIHSKSVVEYLGSNWWNFKNRKADGYALKDYTDDVFNYVLVTNPENQYAILASGNYSDMTTANIPERFTDLTDEANPVRYNILAIAPNAFKDCKNLKAVNFNSRSKITTIGSNAFSGCSGLTKAEFASIESLCSIEFGNQYSNPLNYAHHLYIQGKEVTDLVIPDKFTSIGKYAFNGCTGMNSVTIGNSVESIGSGAFRNCTGLTSVTIPNSVTSIGDYAFYGCTGLNSVTIGNSVESIGSSAFNNCTSLKSVTIPNAVKTVGDYAFSWCTGMNSVTIGNSVESIGSGTFNNCTSLKSVTIPNAVKTVGDYAFRKCSSLTSAIIGNSVTSIGEGAFFGCTGITEVTLLDGNVIEFGKEVFNDTNIKKAYIGRPLPTQVLPLSSLETLTIGNTVTEIGASLWKDASKLKDLTLGNNISAIGDEAFSGCTALTEVIVPPSVETIGASAFAGNTKLASIIMGHNVKTIGEKAYDGCPANTVSITAQTPPTAPNNTFSNYTGKLYLQGQKAIDAYYDAYTCWDRFNSYAMIEPTEMKYEGSTKIEGKPGDTIQLIASLMPENVTLPQVFWRSTNPDIATVDENGLVTLHADPEDVVYADSESGEGATCKIIAESLYANGPVLEVTVTTEQGGVDEILVDDPEDTTTIDPASPYDVYNLSGVWVGDSLEGLSHGFYIVRQGSVAKKIAIK